MQIHWIIPWCFDTTVSYQCKAFTLHYKWVSQYSVNDLSQASSSVSEAMTPWGWRSILQQPRAIRGHVCSFRGHVGSSNTGYNWYVIISFKNDHFCWGKTDPPFISSWLNGLRNTNEQKVTPNTLDSKTIGPHDFLKLDPIENKWSNEYCGKSELNIYDPLKHDYDVL